MGKTLGLVALKLGNRVVVRVQANTRVKVLLELLDKACKGGKIQDAEGSDVYAQHSFVWRRV